MIDFFLRRILVATALCAVARSAIAASFDGFTEPYRKIEVAAAETGTVAQVLVHEGDRVRKGQVVALLDNDVLQVSRQIAQANVDAQGKLESARAERALRKTRVDRLEPLLAEGHASQEELDHARADLAVAEANVRAVEEDHLLEELERKKVEAMIERRTLRSPIDGFALKVLKDECEFVSAGSAGVAIVVQLDPLRAVFSIPGAQAAKLRVGESVDLELPDSGAKVRGKLEFIAPVTEAESGTVRVKALIDNSRGVYRCGVRCLLSIAGPQTALPATESGAASGQ